MASEVRVLLDTHAIIWLAIDRSRIPAAVETALGDAETVLISVVSAWEYGIQRLREGSDLPAPFAHLRPTAIQTADFCRRSQRSHLKHGRRARVLPANADASAKQNRAADARREWGRRHGLRIYAEPIM